MAASINPLPLSCKECSFYHRLQSREYAFLIGLHNCICGKMHVDVRPCWKWCLCLAAVCATPVVVLLAATVVVAPAALFVGSCAVAAACGSTAAVAASAIGASEWCQGSGGGGFRGAKSPQPPRRLQGLDIQVSSWVIVGDCGDCGGGHNHICGDPLSCA